MVQVLVGGIEVHLCPPAPHAGADTTDDRRDLTFVKLVQKVGFPAKCCCPNSSPLGTPFDTEAIQNYTKMSSSGSVLTVASAQLRPTHSIEDTLHFIRTFITEAAKKGADLIILPES